MVLLTKVWDEDRKSHRVTIKQAINELELTKKETKSDLLILTNPYNPLVARVILTDQNQIDGDEFAWVERLTPKTESMLLSIADKHEHGIFW